MSNGLIGFENFILIHPYYVFHLENHKNFRKLYTDIKELHSNDKNVQLTIPADYVSIDKIMHL